MSSMDFKTAVACFLWSACGELGVLADASKGPDGLDFNYVAPLSGPLFLRLTADAPASDVDPWVRCVVIVG